MNQRDMEDEAEERHAADNEERVALADAEAVGPGEKDIAGPGVIRTTDGEGGYFVVFRNNSTVRIGCC